MKHGAHAMAEEEYRGHEPASHHAYMVADFRKRFWVSLIVTMPILLLSPMIQGLLGLKEYLSFPVDLYILFA
ncbi:MAG: heavy metal translocating P-type ATPase, partial [Methanophagales archaeon ANME-1-THS]